MPSQEKIDHVIKCCLADLGETLGVAYGLSERSSFKSFEECGIPHIKETITSATKLLSDKGDYEGCELDDPDGEDDDGEN